MKDLYPYLKLKASGRKKLLLTKNSTPGTLFFDENVVKEQGVEYLIWEPHRSKLAAVLMKGLSELALKTDSKVLYLGAAHGQTVSHLSDIIPKGYILAVELSPHVMRNLVFLSESRQNIIPILADAHHPERYYHVVPAVDFVFQDVAQRDQVDIFVKNCDMYLKPGGHAMIAVKARSVNVALSPDKIYAEAEMNLKKKFKILDKRSLRPYQQDHLMFTLKKV